MSVEYSFLLARFGLSSFSLTFCGSADLGELIVSISFFARRQILYKYMSWFCKPQHP